MLKTYEYRIYSDTEHQELLSKHLGYFLLCNS